jgi:hypothetical protein
VLSGPAILASAAQQAVREWRFKPVLQNGSAVETKARITVNFTIKVADNTGTTLAQSRPKTSRFSAANTRDEKNSSSRLGKGTSFTRAAKVH